MLQTLLEEMDQLPSEEVAERWLQMLRFKAEDIMTIRDMIEKEDIHRNNIYQALEIRTSQFVSGVTITINK